jgi:hypothetical protein
VAAAADRSGDRTATGLWHHPIQPAAGPARRDHRAGSECVFPTCTMPAHRCQVDHTIPHPEGPTAQTNLGPPCEPHHDLKTRWGWQLDQPEEGRFIWTSPIGKRYANEPAQIGPIIETVPPVANSASADPPTTDDPDPPDDPPFSSTVRTQDAGLRERRSWLRHSARDSGVSQAALGVSNAAGGDTVNGELEHASRQHCVHADDFRSRIRPARRRVPRRARSTRPVRRAQSWR